MTKQFRICWRRRRYSLSRLAQMKVQVRPQVMVLFGLPMGHGATNRTQNCRRRFRSSAGGKEAGHDD